MLDKGRNIEAYYGMQKILSAPSMLVCWLIGEALSDQTSFGVYWPDKAFPMSQTSIEKLLVQLHQNTEVDQKRLY